MKCYISSPESDHKMHQQIFHLYISHCEYVIKESTRGFFYFNDFLRFSNSLNLVPAMA